MTEKDSVKTALTLQAISFIACGIGVCAGVLLGMAQMMLASILLAIFGVYFKLIEAEERLK